MRGVGRFSFSVVEVSSGFCSVVVPGSRLPSGVVEGGMRASRSGVAVGLRTRAMRRVFGRERMRMERASPRPRFAPVRR